MKWYRRFLSLFLIFVLSRQLKADEWKSLVLPHTYIYPCNQPPCGNRETHVYSTQFPTAPKSWFGEPDCQGEFRMTSTRWISDYLTNISGISFKGLIYKHILGKRENEFAFFFHEKRCYDGGPEYGWVFPENSYQAFFYLCGNCNLKNQQWCQWPGDPKSKSTCKALGNCSAIAEALRNSARYQYWNIKVTQEGNFLIELIDPITWYYQSCTIQKPDWLPNMYGSNGYITINAQKGAEVTTNPPAYIHIDEVKTLNSTTSTISVKNNLQKLLAMLTYNFSFLATVIK